MAGPLIRSLALIEDSQVSNLYVDLANFSGSGSFDFWVFFARKVAISERRPSNSR